MRSIFSPGDADYRGAFRRCKNSGDADGKRDRRMEEEEEEEKFRARVKIRSAAS